MKIEPEIFKPLFVEINEVVKERSMKALGKAYMTTHNDVKVYINDTGDYFSLYIEKIQFEITFTFRSNGNLELVKDSILYDYKIEMLLLDALETSLYELKPILAELKESRNKIINDLFLKFVSRREISKLSKKELENIVEIEEKIYI